MKHFRKSVVPTYAVVVPWPVSPPPPSPIPVQAQHPDRIPDEQTNTNNSATTLRCQYLLSLLGGCGFIIIVAIIIAVPLLLISHSSSDEPSTTGTTTISSATIITSTATTTAISLRWYITGTTVAGVSNSNGNAAYQLNLPARITIDTSDSLYIADSGNHRIQKYLLNATSGITIAGLPNGIAGSTSSTLQYPSDVAVDSNGSIYVTDSNNHRIQLWSIGASVGTTILGNGTPGSANGQLNYPRGITFDSKSGIFYIADRDNQRVISYSPNTSSINIVAGGNGQGKNITQLNTPVGLDFDSSTNSLVIANYASNNVVRWVLGASSWTLVAGSFNGSSGSSSNTLSGPYDIKVDPMGNTYVADIFNHRIQLFPVGQRNGITIVGVTSVYGSNATLLNSPASVAFDSQFNLYVSDMNNHRIQKFIHY